MEKKEFICIGCPVGCQLTVEISSDEIKVSGNECKIGERYAIKEVTLPSRSISLAVKTNLDGKTKMIAVKTKTDIPKDLLFKCVDEIKKLKINYKVKIGDVLIKNVLDTGSDIVAISSNFE